MARARLIVMGMGLAACSGAVAVDAGADAASALDSSFDASQPDATPPIDGGTAPSDAGPMQCSAAELSTLLTDTASQDACFGTCLTRQDCLQACFAMRTGIAASCTVCAAQLYGCGGAHCASPCRAGILDSTCGACLCTNGCIAALELCAGQSSGACAVPVDGGPPGADGGASIDAGTPIDAGPPPRVDAGSCLLGPESTAAACGDGCDNDDDGILDCAEASCAGLAACPRPDAGPPPGLCTAEPDGERNCADGCDNDSDSLVDCADPDCRGVAGCPTSLCTAGATRCIAGAAAVREVCAGGAWVRTPCPSMELCTNGACAVVCGYPPASAFVCFVPNHDGVNDGILYYTNQPTLLGAPTFSTVYARAFSGRTASIQSIPAGDSASWPYEWRLEALADSRLVEIQFRLDQFAASLGPGLRTVTLRYLARRQPPIDTPSGRVDFETRTLRYAWTAAAGYFSVDVVPRTNLSYLLSTETFAVPAVSSVNHFGYAGQWNAMGIQSIGDDFGGPPMETYVNYVLLTVE